MRRLLKKKVFRVLFLSLILFWLSSIVLNYYQDYSVMTIDSVQTISEIDEFGAYQMVGHTGSKSYVLSCYNEKDYKCFVPNVRSQHNFSVEPDHQIWFKDSSNYSLTWLVDSETAR